MKKPGFLDEQDDEKSEKADFVNMIEYKNTIFAADMAKYNYGDIESPLYGTIEELTKRYGIDKAVSINVWRCGEKSADEINTRLQTAESSRNVRMDGSKANVGIAIVANNEFFYVAKVFTN